MAAAAAEATATAAAVTIATIGNHYCTYLIKPLAEISRPNIQPVVPKSLQICIEFA